MASRNGQFLLRHVLSGTKITYNRDMLLMLQQSPHSKSPINLSAFPGLGKTTHVTTIAVEPETVRNPLFFLRVSNLPLPLPPKHHDFTPFLLYLSGDVTSHPVLTPSDASPHFSSIPLVRSPGSCYCPFIFRYVLSTSVHIFSTLLEPIGSG